MAKVKTHLFKTIPIKLSRLFFLWGFFLPIFAIAQNKIDSLKKLLNTAQNDTEKIILLNQIADKYYQNEDENKNAIEFAYEAYLLASKNNFKKGMADALNNIGRNYFISGDSKAIGYYLKALKIREEIGDKKGAGDCYNNIATLFRSQNNFSEALKYYHKALDVYHNINDKQRIASTLTNIGYLYNEQDKYIPANEFYLNALKIRKEIGDSIGIAITLGHLGDNYNDLGKTDSALKCIETALAIYKKANKKSSIASTLGKLGDVYFNNKKYSLAINNYEECLKLASETGSAEIREVVYDRLAEAYAIIHNTDKAYEYLRLYTQLKDSLLNKETTAKINELTTKYETEKKELKIKNLEQEQIITDTKLNRQKIIIWISVIGGIIILFFFIVLFNRFQTTKKQKHIIEEKNKEITDSINYAKRIQEAILPMEETFRKNFPESFILYKPKDIVSGDFYWLAEKDNKIIFTAVDCTGHGVPGAFMSLIGFSLLNQIIKEQNITIPSEILKGLSKGINLNFKQNELSEVKDGMDIALCAIDKEKNILEYSGAYNPLFYFRQNQFHQIKADKTAIGDFNENIKYTNHKIDLQKHDTIYIFSDGYTDQFGGTEQKKFKNKKFQELLLSIQDKSMTEQKDMLDLTIQNWKGNLEQTDDILVIGIKI